MALARCIRCNAEKPISDFYSRGGGRTGRDTTCKTCRLARQKARLQQRPKHYVQPPTSGTKTCSSCRLDLPVQEFARNRTAPDGLQPWCRHCRREYSRKWRLKPQRRDSEYRKAYGISLAEYDHLYRQQSGKCAICGTQDAGSRRKLRLCVDHCHRSGRVRGLLCNRCNIAVGLFNDDPCRAEKAAAYLRTLEVANVG
jgi:hypothetical protein